MNPRVSVSMPFSTRPREFLREAVQNVCNQRYHPRLARMRRLGVRVVCLFGPPGLVSGRLHLRRRPREAQP
jgi:hypothetical protein